MYVLCAIYSCFFNNPYSERIQGTDKLPPENIFKAFFQKLNKFWCTICHGGPKPLGSRGEGVYPCNPPPNVHLQEEAVKRPFFHVNGRKITQNNLGLITIICMYLLYGDKCRCFLFKILFQLFSTIRFELPFVRIGRWVNNIWIVLCRSWSPTTNKKEMPFSEPFIIERKIKNGTCVLAPNASRSQEFTKFQRFFHMPAHNGIYCVGVRGEGGI